MSQSSWKSRVIPAALMCVSVATVARAVDLPVNCSLPGAAGQIGTALKKLDPAATNTLRISGYCHENIVIWGFDRLSLIASPGAVVDDNSGGQNPVFYIGDSRRVVIQGFDIRGGNNTVNCDNGSVCRLINSELEQTASGAGFNARDSQAELTNVTLQENADWGIYAQTSKMRLNNVTIRDVKGGPNEPAGIGIAVDSTEVSANNLTIKNAGGSGIYLFKHSFLQAVNSNISNNGGWGIGVLFGSTASLNGTTVSNNPNANGVFIDDASSVVFNGGNFTNNGSLDIFCGKQSAAARWIETTQYGSTNCPVPAPDL